MQHRVGLGAGDRLLDVAHLRDGLPLRAELALVGYLADRPAPAETGGGPA